MIVHHFGPDPSTVGGMATVIRLCTEHSIGGETVDCYPTWSPHSPLVTVRLAGASALALLRIPKAHLVHIHLSEGGSFLREGAIIALASRRGLVTVATIHGASFIKFARRQPRLVSWVLQRASLVICLEQETLEIVRRGAPRVRSEIVPNPVFVDDTSSYPVDETDEFVVFAGEIGVRKGADVLHRAWKHVAQRRPDARCLMVGPITDFTPPPAERLEVRPAVDWREMKEILRRARVVALPSRAEGMPMVLVEAMSLARPFVSTPVGGISELAEGGGVIVPVEDDVGLADRLSELLASPDRARSIGERGRQFCLDTRSIEVTDARLRDLYSAAMRDRS